MYNSILCYATCSTDSDRMRSLFCVGVIQGGAGIYTHGGGMRGVCKSHEYLDPPPFDTPTLHRRYNSSSSE